MNRSVILSGLLAVFLAIVPTGCGGGARTMGPDEDLSPDRTPVQEIGSMYQLFIREFNRPPKSIADFDKYAPGMSYGYDSLKRGEQVVIWGVNLDSSPEAASTVLAFQKQAPAQGGYVLMKDGTTVKKLSAEEFKAAPKAGPVPAGS